MIQNRQQPHRVGIVYPNCFALEPFVEHSKHTISLQILCNTRRIGCKHTNVSIVLRSVPIPGKYTPLSSLFLCAALIELGPFVVLPINNQSPFLLRVYMCNWGKQTRTTVLLPIIMCKWFQKQQTIQSINFKIQKKRKKTKSMNRRIKIIAFAITNH